MPRVTRKMLPPPVSDRPGRWQMLWRRQRRMLRPTVLVGTAMVACVGYIALTQIDGRGARLHGIVGRATGALGLRVKVIRFDGVKKTQETALRGALGVSEGDAILGFSPDDARAAIEKLTWVQSATVERRLPETIVVTLVERSPFAVWQNQGRFVLIDRAGKVVADQDVAVFAKELPLVVGPGAPEAAAALITALAEQPSLQGRITAAVRVGERRWNLRLSNGTDVMLPEGAEALALARLVELQNEHALLDRPAQAVDMRLPDRIVLRPRVDPPAASPQQAKRPT